MSSFHGWLPCWGWAGGDGAALHSQIGSVLGPAPSSLGVRAWQEQRGTETSQPPPCSWLAPSCAHPTHPGGETCSWGCASPPATGWGGGSAWSKPFPAPKFSSSSFMASGAPPAEEIPPVEVRWQEARRCGSGGVLPAALPFRAASVPQGCACLGGAALPGEDGLEAVCCGVVGSLG